MSLGILVNGVAISLISATLLGLKPWRYWRIRRIWYRRMAKRHCAKGDHQDREIDRAPVRNDVGGPMLLVLLSCVRCGRRIEVDIWD